MFNPNKLAVVSDFVGESTTLRNSYNSMGWKCDLYTAECWEKLELKIKKYSHVIIDNKLGNGLMATEISKTLFSTGHNLKIFLLVTGSMIFYTRYASIVLMKATVLHNPGIIFDTECDRPSQMTETVMMTRALLHGSHR